MTTPTPDQLTAAHEAETRAGDTYGVDIGHLVMPDGSLIAVAQNDDATARALVYAYRDLVLA